MRISTQQIFGNGVSSMQKLSAQQQMTQQQIASGKRVLNPADDPAAATRILQMTDEIARIEQFKKNVDSVDNRLKQEDATLGSITDVLTRVRELAIQSGDGALSAEDRKFIAAELRQRLEQMAGLMNTRDATGEYIFAGHQGGKPAFAQD
ncbi:MAG: flagellar hook-associated protein FlgL, partial [Gammaproteobacteria bacterium]|nr:flagellar hook-associated protein FlgL [Gammaproteobacteria bacterium]